jgi:hypothetical protein
MCFNIYLVRYRGNERYTMVKKTMVFIKFQISKEIKISFRMFFWLSLRISNSKISIRDRI